MPICGVCKIKKQTNEYYTKDAGSKVYGTCKQCCITKNVKQCNVCKEIKNLTEYYINKKYNKTRIECKNCTNQRKKEWKKNNREHYIQQAKEYRSRPEIKEKNNQYQKEYYNKPGIKQRKAELARINDNKKYKTDVNFKFKKILRARLIEVLKQNTKTDTTLNLLGCNIDEFKKWIEYQFDANMTWENHGTYWHIDHVKPCSIFNFANEEDQKICFCWKNLRPMRCLDNIKKGDNYNEKIRHLHEIVLKSYIIKNIHNIL